MSTEWRMSRDLATRVGCTAVAATVLPLWFGAVFLVVKKEWGALTLAVAAGFAVAACVGGVIGWRRALGAPRAVVVEDDGSIALLRGRGGRVRRVLDAPLLSMEIGASAGLGAIRVKARNGQTVRLPAALDDFEGFLAALQSSNSALSVLDHRSAPIPREGEP